MFRALTPGGRDVVVCAVITSDSGWFLGAVAGRHAVTALLWIALACAGYIACGVPIVARVSCRSVSVLRGASNGAATLLFSYVTDD